MSLVYLQALLQNALKKRESVRGEGPRTGRSSPDETPYGGASHRGQDESGDDSSCAEEAARVVRRAEAKHPSGGERLGRGYDGGDQDVAGEEEEDREAGGGSGRLQQRQMKKSPSSKLLEPTRAYEVGYSWLSCALIAYACA
jgi:hypothetical protein